MRRAAVHFYMCIKAGSTQITVMDQNHLNPNRIIRFWGWKHTEVVRKDSKFVFFVEHLVLH